MERRSFVKNAGLAGVLAAGAAPAIVHAQANIRWRMASSFPKQLDTIYGGGEVVAKRVEPRWLRPTRGSPTSIVRVAEDEIAEARRTAPGRPVVLNAMFHNVEVVPGTSPYASSEGEARGILDRLGALLAFAKRESIPVIGLGDVPELFGHG